MAQQFKLLHGSPTTYIGPNNNIFKRQNRGEHFKMLTWVTMFYNKIPTAQATKAELDKWDYIELRSFSTMKEIIYRIKRQLVESKKIFTDNTSEKRLTSRLYINIYGTQKFNNNKTICFKRSKDTG